MRRVTDLAANVVRDRRTSWWSNARGQMAPVDRSANTAEASARRYSASRNLRLSRQLIGPSRRADMCLLRVRVPEGIRKGFGRASNECPGGYRVTSLRTGRCALG
jgi:hypothetical protein